MHICDHWTHGRVSEQAFYGESFHYITVRRQRQSLNVRTHMKQYRSATNACGKMRLVTIRNSYGFNTDWIRTDLNNITYHIGFFFRACSFDNYQSLTADLIIHVRVRTLRIRYESLRIGRINTEALSATSAAYVSASVT